MTRLAQYLVASLIGLGFACPVAAQDAAWRSDAPTGVITDDANWIGGLVPTGIGFFNASSSTALTTGSDITFGGLTLNATAGNYTLTIGHNLAFTGSGIVIDGGSLAITNAHGLVFYNSSSAGDATIVNNVGSELAFTMSSTAGRANITNNGTLIFANSASAGSAQLTNNAGGVIDFSASAGPGFGGKHSAGSIAGAGSFYLGAYELSAGSNNLDTTVSGVISDCGATGTQCMTPGATGGALVKTGTGTMTLAGTNTYSGGTTFAGGTLSVASDSNLGLATGALNFDGGVLQVAGTSFNSTGRTIDWRAGGGGFDIVDAATTFTLSGPLQELAGSGGLIKRGAGTLTIDNTASYTGLTDVQGGTLQAGSNGALSLDSRHNIAAGATLDLNGTAGQGVGSLTGAGTVTTSGNGLSILFMGLDNTSATFAGTIKDGTHGGTIQVWIESPGVTTFTGTNTYTGGTRICDCATLQIGNGGTTGAITGTVFNSGTLIFNRSNSYTFAGIIEDDFSPGRLVQAGTGNTILTGFNTYTGTTTVSAGTLSVNGSIASSSLTTVTAGGTLGGTGTVGDVRINGGALAPGNSVGTLTVQGNLIFTTAARYMVEVDSTGSDRTNVTGHATLGGATVNAAFATGSYVTRQYTILSANIGLTGKFNSQINTNLPTSFVSALSYDANNVYLDVALNYVSPGPNGTPLNTNQTNVANALVGSFNRDGGIPLAFGALTPTGLTQASGETGVGLHQTSVQAMNLFLGVMTDPTMDGRTGFAPVAGASGFADEALAYAPSNEKRNAAARDAYGLLTKAVPRARVFDPNWSVWSAGFGGSQTTDGNTALGSNTTTSRSYGFAVGADYLWAPQTVAGFALSGGGNTFSVANGGSGSSDMFQAGAYLRHAAGSAYVTAAAAYGWQDVTTDRTVTAAGFDRLRARFHANAFSGRVELGNRFVEPWTNGIGITPYAALQVTALDLPAYAESVVAGAGNFALNFAARIVTAPRMELGLRSDKSIALDDALLTLRGRAAWAHDTTADRSLQATFQSLPGASFTVNGAMAARNAALTSAAVELNWLNGFSLAATFEGEFSDVTRSYAGKGVARYTW